MSLTFNEFPVGPLIVSTVESSTSVAEAVTKVCLPSSRRKRLMEVDVKLTDEERRYLACLARPMTFEEMAAELGMMVEGVRDFGMEFFERAGELAS